MAETAVEEIDPASAGAGESEVVLDQTGEAPEVAARDHDVTVEDVLEASEAVGCFTSSRGTTLQEFKQDPKNATSFLDIVHYEIVMSNEKLAEWNVKFKLDKLVAEMFSPPRFTHQAHHLGLNPGFAVDLQTGWDLDDPKQVEATWTSSSKIKIPFC